MLTIVTNIFWAVCFFLFPVNGQCSTWFCYFAFHAFPSVHLARYGSDLFRRYRRTFDLRRLHKTSISEERFCMFRLYLCMCVCVHFSRRLKVLKSCAADLKIDLSASFRVDCGAYHFSCMSELLTSQVDGIEPMNFDVRDQSLNHCPTEEPRRVDVD